MVLVKQMVSLASRRRKTKSCTKYNNLDEKLTPRFQHILIRVQASWFKGLCPV